MKVTCFIVMDWAVRSTEGGESEACLERVRSELSGTKVRVQLLCYLHRGHRRVKSSQVRTPLFVHCGVQAGVRQEGRDAPDRSGQVLLFKEASEYASVIINLNMNK